MAPPHSSRPQSTAPTCKSETPLPSTMSLTTITNTNMNATTTTSSAQLATMLADSMRENEQLRRELDALKGGVVRNGDVDAHGEHGEFLSSHLSLPFPVPPLHPHP